MDHRTDATDFPSDPKNLSTLNGGAPDEENNHYRLSDDDRTLIEKLKAGDDAAFSQLVRQYYGPLVRFAMIFTSDRAVAEEVVQETWVGVIRGLDSFEGRSSLKTWIFRILSNRAKTRGAREKRTIVFSALDGPDGEAYEPDVDPHRFDASGHWTDPPGRWDTDLPDSILERKELATHIKNEIEKLPPLQRAVVTMRDIDGLDAEEVCNILELSETNQRVLLHRGRSRVRAALESYLNGDNL